jgi:hypothetical protein
VSEPQVGYLYAIEGFSLVYGRSQHGAGAEPVQGFLGRLSRGGRFSWEALIGRPPWTMTSLRGCCGVGWRMRLPRRNCRPDVIDPPCLGLMGHDTRATGLAGPSVDHQHGGLHGAGAEPVQRFPAGVTPPPPMQAA